LHDDAQHRNCIGGAAGYIDTQFFTSSHIYSNPTANSVYDTGAFDPEGTLGKYIFYTYKYIFMNIYIYILRFDNSRWLITKLISHNH